jgi:uncharacterized membrane protein YfcA
MEAFFPGPWGYAVLFCAGVLVAFINSVSGGGSILSLPLLIFMGLPAATANGTNRLGILLGSIASLLAFRSQGIFLPRQALQVGWPAAIASLAGSLIAVRLSDRVFDPILAGVIIFVVISIIRSSGNGAARAGTPELRNDWLAWIAYAAIGFYGGFIQAGSGLVMMAVFKRMGNLDIFQINALKVSNTVIFIAVSLATFAAAGRIEWPMAAALAAGNLTGGWIGSLWQLRLGEAWVKRFLLWTGLAIAGKLLWSTWVAWGKG